LTSTDIADLFDCGYSNYEELFNRKLKGLDSTFVPNKRSDWGKALEPSIAEEFARKNDWNIQPKKHYIRIPSLRLGSSFDYSLLEECGTNNEDRTLEEVALIEIKNVDWKVYKYDWIQGFEIEAPAKIELQCLNELLVSGLDILYLCALIGGNDDITLKITPNEKIQKAILLKANEFWEKIDQERLKT
jgi:predicted phage-related endonuclease